MKDELRDESHNTKQRTVRKARRAESVLNSAIWHLTQRDMTESELLLKLHVKTDNQEWIDQALTKLRDYGYLKSDRDFAIQFIERSYSGEYASRYIIDKLSKKGIPASIIEDELIRFIADREIDEQAILNERITHYYPVLTMSREKLVSTLQKRGFSYQQVQIAINQHSDKENLRTALEIKGAGADLEWEILKIARKGKGATVIKQELRQRKIDTGEFESVLSSLINAEQIDFYTSCQQQLEKKDVDISTSKGRSKAYAMLTRRGFSSDEIRFAFDCIA
jgi:regulatory protein